jgi:enoyl-CoA hydratase/carnithine racemase
MFTLAVHACATVVTLCGEDATNKLSRARVLALTEAIAGLEAKPLIFAGNHRFFSAGADLAEIAALRGPDAFDFARMGQALMRAIASFPAPTFAAVSGYCMGGGLDLALACRFRIAAPNAIFGHRGAALGLMTGWGGTQRLPRLVGRARALEMFVCAEKIHAHQALEWGLIDAIADDPVAECLHRAERPDITNE